MNATIKNRAYYANLTDGTDLEYRISEALDRWPNAEVASVEEIAGKAQRTAEETERRGVAEGWSYGAAQTQYGCDWRWADEDEPTARVYDCDGETVAILTAEDL